MTTEYDLPFPNLTGQPSMSEEQHRIAQMNFTAYLSVCSSYTKSSKYTKTQEDQLWAQHYNQQLPPTSDQP